MRTEVGMAGVIEDAQIPKWPTGADCKSAGFAFGGSNPPLRTRQGEGGARVRALILFLDLRK